MSIIPSRNGVTVIEGDSGVNLDNLQVNEVPYKADDGTLKSSGLRMLSSGSLLAPVGFAVESGSVDFGDVLRLSESAGFLAFENMVDKNKYQLLDYAVPRNAPSSKPYYFKLIEAEKVFQAVSGTDAITANPLTYEYTTQLTARTNSLTFNAKAKMLNVRIRITDKASGIAVKYFPSKSSWLTGVNGTTFEIGDNTLDFQDTALILQANTTLVFDIQADSVNLSGSNGVAAFSGTTQKGVFIAVADEGDVAALQSQISAVTTPFSGKYVDLTGVPATFAPSPHQHPTSDITGLDTKLSTLTSNVQQANSNLAGLSAVATSGSYLDLTNKPALFSGLYSDLTNKPILFDGKYSSLTDKPTSFTPSAHTHSITDVMGLQASLDSKLDQSSFIPVNASFSFKGLNDTDDSALANGYLIWNSTGTSISYSTTIPFNAISGKPTTLSGYGITDGVSTSSLSGTLASYVTTAAQTSVLTNYVTNTALTNGLATKANTSHTHVIADVTGLQNALDAKASANSLIGLRKVETFLGVSDASGNLTITFANTYTTPPDVQPQLVGATFNQFVRIVSVSNTGCVINAGQRNLATLLGIEVLLAATVVLAGASITIQVTPRA
jgi:hypothetical protein